MSEGEFQDRSAYAGRPSVCRNCGALVGAGETNCLMCGAPTRSSAQREEQRAQPRIDPETHRFLRAIISRPATFTFIFLTACVFVFLLMMLSGGANGQVLIEYGAKLNSLIDEQGQWWRFVTPIFLHVNVPGLGPLHLLVNMYSLFMLGPYVEKLYGSAKFVVFWIATGIAGVAASYFSVQPALVDSTLGRFIFKTADVPSAGASGALFGLVGVLFVFGIKFRHELPEGFKRAFGTGMLPMILINLFIGFVGSGFIDNAAHLGGLVSGALLALFVGYKRPGERAGIAVAWHVLQGLALALVLVSFFQVIRHFNAPAPSLQNAREKLNPFAVPNVDGFISAMNEGQEAFTQKLTAGDRGGVDAAIEKLGAAPSLDKDADALREELKSLLIRGRDLSSTQPEGKGRAAQRERAEALEKIVADYQDWEMRFDRWVKTEGQKYGLSLIEPSPEAEGKKQADEEKSQGAEPDAAPPAPDKK